MPPADLTVAPPSLDRAGPEPGRAIVHGWGGGDAVQVALLAPDRVAAVSSALPRRDAKATGAIARGMGRSYGDAAQLAGGVVLEMTAMRRFRLDSARGEVWAEAGATIGQLLAKLVPAGWMLPVVPGTQHVTVGGAIASDIHGKNHASAGTFGAHVRALGLLTSAGEVLELAPGEDDGLFQATVGGMGLTGVILWARIGLRPVSSSMLSVDTDRASGLDHALALLSSPGGSYRVAWLDLLGPRPGRGVVTRAEHLDAAPTDGQAGGGPGRDHPVGWGATVAARATVPRRWPGGLLRQSTVRVFNELRFRRSPRSERGRIESIGRHMFPLDALECWPRLYGPGGFLQYQFVVPAAEALVLSRVIELLRRAGVPCFLAVLKDLGQGGSAPLSFPLRGWTITLDLPRSAPGLLPALERCDELVVAAGGRVYLTKDARLRPAVLPAMYPRLPQWQAVRERADPGGLWRSDLALRTGLVSPG